MGPSTVAVPTMTTTINAANKVEIETFPRPGKIEVLLHPPSLASIRITSATSQLQETFEKPLEMSETIVDQELQSNTTEIEECEIKRSVALDHHHHVGVQLTTVETMPQPGL